jgi:hypothetical protein
VHFDSTLQMVVLDASGTWVIVFSWFDSPSELDLLYELPRTHSFRNTTVGKISLDE